MSKLLEKNITCTSEQSMFAHKFLGKKNIFYIPYNKQIFDASIQLFASFFLSFYRGHIIYFFLQKNVNKHKNA
jgi:hypothetical protein